MEVRKWEISYFVNEVALGVAFWDDWLLGHDLYPFVCLYDAGDVVKLIK